MPDSIPIADADRELPVPDVWRPILKALADATVAGNLSELVAQRPAQISSTLTDQEIAERISSYGEDFGPLSEKAWQSSVYCWMDGYWSVLLDLSTADGKRSDLVLFAEVAEAAPGYTFRLSSVHVP